MAARRSLLLIALPVALAACGGGGGGAAKAPAGPTSLARAADATLAQPSEDVTLSAKVDLAGQTLSLDGSGGFDNKADTGRLDLNLALGALGSSKLDAVYRKNVVWLRSPLLAAALHGKQWVRVDLGKQAKALGFDLNALTGETPASALKVVRLPGTVSQVGSEKVDGVETRHYHKALTSTVAGTAYRSVDAWVDGENLIRRLKLDYSAKIDPAGKQGARTLVTMTLSNFGTDVSVAVPPADQVVDSSQVKG
jgi:hypothetical protein